MKTWALVMACVIGLATGIRAEAVAQWALEPARDTFSPEAAFDLRTLNENTAGQSGFVRVKDGDLVLGDGSPARFWAITTYVGREQPFVKKPLGPKDEPQLGHHARWLAKRGVNLVKVLGAIYPDADKQPNEPLGATNPAERDWIWRTVAAMKKEGIYTAITRGPTTGPERLTTPVRRKPPVKGERCNQRRGRRG